MKPRHQRLLWVLAGVVLVGMAVTLVLRALDANVMFFYSPARFRQARRLQVRHFVWAAWSSRVLCSAQAMVWKWHLS